MLIGPLGTNFSENSIAILIFSLTKMRLKVSSAKWRPFCLCLNVLSVRTSSSLMTFRHISRRRTPGTGLGFGRDDSFPMILNMMTAVVIMRVGTTLLVKACSTSYHEDQLVHVRIALTLRNKRQWNHNKNSSIFFQENAFKNVICEMVAILSRPQSVKGALCTWVLVSVSWLLLPRMIDLINSLAPGRKS